MRRSVVLALLALGLLAAPAAAAERNVPRGWLGVVADGPLTAPGAAMDGEWDLMAANGVESVRTAFYWPSAQREESAPPDLARFDSVVLAAARRNLTVLPIVTGTPGWAGRMPGDETSPPRDPQLYAGFLKTLVARYGPSGSLWAEHPEVPRRAIRDWQIWNEPNLTRYWTPPRGQGFARPYVRLLAAADRAGLLVHLALPRGVAELVRLLGPPAAARRAPAERARAGGVPPRRPAPAGL